MPRKAASKTNPQTKETKKKKPPALPDSIFFIKEQIKIGTILTYYGRLNPQSSWRVDRIVSHKLSPRGTWTPEPVKTVRYLSDIVYLGLIGTTFVRQGSFSHLSYSAIWRIP